MSAKKGATAIVASDARAKTTTHDEYTRQPEDTKTFFECLFEPDDIVELRLIYPLCRTLADPAKKLPTKSRWGLAGDISVAIDSLREKNAEGYGIYCGANPRKCDGGSTAEDVSMARSLVVDFDGVELPACRMRCDDAGLPGPTLVVSSGGGYHFWWKLDTPLTDLATYTAHQKGLIAEVHSDHVIHDPPRIIRMPGFINTKVKRGGAVASIVECYLERVYALSEFPRLQDEPTAEQMPPGPPPTPSSNGKVAKCLSAMLQLRGADKTDGTNRLYKVACRCVEHGLSDIEALSVIHTYERVVPFPKRYTDDDILKRVRDAENKAIKGEAVDGRRRRVDGAHQRRRRGASKNRVAYGGQSKLEEAMEWITSMLADGPVLSSKMIKDGEIVFAPATLNRAKKKCGVMSCYETNVVGGSLKAHWRLDIINGSINTLDNTANLQFKT